MLIAVGPVKSVEETVKVIFCPYSIIWAKFEFLERGRQLPYRCWRRVFTWRPKGGVGPSDTTRTSRVFSERGAVEIIECPVDIDDYMVAPSAFPKNTDGEFIDYFP